MKEILGILTLKEDMDARELLAIGTFLELISVPYLYLTLKGLYLTER